MGKNDAFLKVFLEPRVRIMSQVSVHVKHMSPLSGQSAQLIRNTNSRTEGRGDYGCFILTGSVAWSKSTETQNEMLVVLQLNQGYNKLLSVAI